MPIVTRKRIKHLFTFDLETGKIFWKNPPKYHPDLTGTEAGTNQYTHSGKQYRVIHIDYVAYKRGHLIFFFVNGQWPKPCLDHINGNSLDDKPINLRDATVIQNAWNHKTHKRRIKLPMGVRVIPKSGRYEARISYYGKQLHLGSYATPEEAEIVYIAKRKELYADYSGYATV